MKQTVTQIMSIGIVAHFKIIQIQHGNTGIHHLISHTILKIPSIVSPGKRINIQLVKQRILDIAGQVNSFPFNDQFFLHLTRHLHHIWFAVDFHIPGNDLIQITSDIFQFGFLILFHKHLCCDTSVFTARLFGTGFALTHLRQFLFL